mmetsp:Transcript_25315/g.79860  ORF Transcript_25315/g.79860 Transcript_25315/m.79860 type:complete len:164 (-) Transcript_25315:107-598(-)
MFGCCCSEHVRGHEVLTDPPRKGDFPGLAPEFAAPDVQATAASAAKDAAYPKLLPEPKMKVAEDSEFTISLTKSEASIKVGLMAVPKKHKGLRVKEVRPGLLAQWNADHPDLEVRPGDHVVAVNGVGRENGPDPMLDRLTEDTVLEILVRRQMATDTTTASEV